MRSNLAPRQEEMRERMEKAPHNIVQDETLEGGDMLSQGQAARLLFVSVKQIQNWRRQGRIAYFRFGHRTIRIPRSQVERLMKEARFA